YTGPPSLKLRRASCFAQRITLNPAKRPSAKQDEDNPTRSLQRRCPCHYHHDYGAGIEGAACGRTCRVKTGLAGIAELRAEFHLRRHLLEQSSSLVPGG